MPNFSTMQLSNIPILLMIYVLLDYRRVRFLKLMSKIDLLRGQLPLVTVETMSTILSHSFKGNSLVCNHGNKQCWKNSSNPYYLALICHMIHCHTSLCDVDSVIPLVDRANDVAEFATVTCSKQLKSVVRAGNHSIINCYYCNLRAIYRFI